jgi:hypothetical protein
MGVHKCVRRTVVCLVAVLILAAIPSAAQLPTGTILGTVKDSSGASDLPPIFSPRIMRLSPGFWPPKQPI